MPPVKGLGGGATVVRVEEANKYEFEYTLSGGLPDGYIPALVNHICTLFGK